MAEAPDEAWLYRAVTPEWLEAAAAAGTSAAAAAAEMRKAARSAEGEAQVSGVSRKTAARAFVRKEIRREMPILNPEEKLETQAKRDW